MIDFPNAKINLGLNITERRPDGYHNLETIFYPIPLTDALEIVPSEDPSLPAHQCRLFTAGVEIAGDAESNLVVRAYRLLDELVGLPAVDIHLLKHIPTGAGLGGGSSDCAFTLKLLNRLLNLQLNDDKLEELSARLGADCAFFVRNRPTFAEGIGNIFSPVELSLKGMQLWLVKPDIFVSTREAFAHIRPRRPDVSPREACLLPVSQWKEALTNDFEESVFHQFPAIVDIKERLYDLGALYASMSGSGSSVYGLFAPETELPEADFGEGCFQSQMRLE